MSTAEVESLTFAQLDTAIETRSAELAFLKKVRKLRTELKETLAGMPPVDAASVPTKAGGAK